MLVLCLFSQSLAGPLRSRASLEEDGVGRVRRQLGNVSSPGMSDVDLKLLADELFRELNGTGDMSHLEEQMRAAEIQPGPNASAAAAAALKQLGEVCFSLISLKIPNKL